MKALLTFVLLINSFFCIGQQKLESYRQLIDGTALGFTMQPVPAGEFMMGSGHGKADERLR